MSYEFRFGWQLDLSHQIPEIPLDKRFQHSYIIGKTDMGKSILMERMVDYDIKQGISTILIDPKGVSAKKLFYRNPDRCIYISKDNPLVINPLKKDLPLEDIITEFVQILDVLITHTTSNPESTVLMRELIDMALHILPADKRSIDMLTKFLNEPKERKILVSRLKEENKRTGKEKHLDLIEYWDMVDDMAHNKLPINRYHFDAAKRVASRLTAVSRGVMSRFVIGENEFNIKELLNSGKSLLVDLSEISFHQQIYISNFLVYALVSYCTFEKIKEKPLLVYIDEFQRVSSFIFADLLATSRGSKIGFTLAHQNFLQIDKAVLGSILGNVSTYVVFRVGYDEADMLSKTTGVPIKEILNLPEHSAYLRIGINNTLIETYPPLESDSIDLPTRLKLNFLRPDWIQI